MTGIRLKISMHLEDPDKGFPNLIWKLCFSLGVIVPLLLTTLLITIMEYRYDVKSNLKGYVDRKW
jgi:hypothetical protein